MSRRPGEHQPVLIWAGTLLVFLLAWCALMGLYWHYPGLPDTDSCYHLAVARAFAHEGIINELPWTRFSALRDGFGDKEVGFHILLMPFAALEDVGVAGRLALSFFGALVAGALAYLGARAAGLWGLLLPLLLAVTSLGFDSRLNRLRPELLALFLLLLAVRAAGTKRYRTLGLLSAAFALSYTAFYAFLGLFGMLFVYRVWVRDRWDWPLLLYPSVGAGLGLVLHPNFPHNLTVWVVQNITNYTTDFAVPFSPENFPATTRSLLLSNLAWVLAVMVWVRSRSPGGQKAPEDETADGFWLAAGAFFVLMAQTERFALYFFPFFSLALLFEGRRRGWVPGPWLSLPFRARVPTLVALLACVLLGLPGFLRWAGSPVDASRQGWWREQAWQELSSKLPEGAKVAAKWSDSQAYMLWAPQGRYLNALNPVFMSVPYPLEYAVKRAVFEGLEPDVPLAVATTLDSRYLAFIAWLGDPRFTARLENDPRIYPLHEDRDVLVRLEPDANDSFVLEWEAREDGQGEWRPYPRAESPEGRRFEGYVDGRRILQGEEPGCVRFRRSWNLEEPGEWSVELAPFGPTMVWLNDEPIISIGGSLGAVLGRGVHLARQLDTGTHRLEILTCPPQGPSRDCGFYLRDVPNSLRD